MHTHAHTTTGAGSEPNGNSARVWVRAKEVRQERWGTEYTVGTNKVPNGIPFG